MNQKNKMTIIDQITANQQTEPFIEDRGKDLPLVTIVACMHGNEHVGLRVLEFLRTQTILQGTLRLVVANPNATLQNRRFIDSNLNDSFPGKQDGGIEEQLAFKLRKALSDSDILIDLHTTTASTPPFIITHQYNENIKRLINSTGIKRVVLKPKLSKTALIDYGENRIGIELGKHNSEATLINGLSATMAVLSNMGMVTGKLIIKKTKPELFTVTEIIQLPLNFEPKKDGTIQNFRLIKQGNIIGISNGNIVKAEDNFYPILYGETSYINTLCWKGKKM